MKDKVRELEDLHIIVIMKNIHTHINLNVSRRIFGNFGSLPEFIRSGFDELGLNSKQKISLVRNFAIDFSHNNEEYQRKMNNDLILTSSIDLFALDLQF